VRQGEWFFIPRPEFLPRDEGLILRNEPIRRLRGTPHIVEWLYRVGGEIVYVSNRNDLSRRGLTEKEYRQLLRENPIAQSWDWRLMRRNPRAYARGKVRHPDHRTIELPFWHRVVISNEQGNGNNVFLD